MSNKTLAFSLSFFSIRPQIAQLAIEMIEVISHVRLFHNFAWLQPLLHFHYIFWRLLNAPSSGLKQFVEYSCPHTRVTRIHLFRKRVNPINSNSFSGSILLLFPNKCCLLPWIMGFHLVFINSIWIPMLKSSILHNKCSRNWMIENFRQTIV